MEKKNMYRDGKDTDIKFGIKLFIVPRLSIIRIVLILLRKIIGNYGEILLNLEAYHIP